MPDTPPPMPTRRAALAIAGAALLARPALAQQGPWPNRPIRLVTPFAPGGTTDIVARILAAQLSPRLGQAVVVENRPGAGATLGAQLVAEAPPDGHVLIVSNSASHGISPSLFKNVRYDALADFTHIALAATTSTALVVNPRFEARTVQDLIAIAKQRGGVDFAISGHGTTTHLLGMRLALAAGVTFNVIPYRGAGPALTDVISGTVPFFVDGLPSSIPHLRAGSLRALAVADPQRNRFLPEVPTLIESGFPGMVSYSWFGVSGPKGMERAVVDRLNGEIRAVLRLPEVQQRYLDLTADAPDLTPEQYTDYVREELRVWAEVVRATGATAD